MDEEELIKIINSIPQEQLESFNKEWREWLNAHNPQKVGRRRRPK